MSAGAAVASHDDRGCAEWRREAWEAIAPRLPMLWRLEVVWRDDDGALCAEAEGPVSPRPCPCGCGAFGAGYGRAEARAGTVPVLAARLSARVLSCCAPMGSA